MNLRPFKKGPFVLAIASQTPIVPTVVHGSIEVMAKGSWMINAGRVAGLGSPPWRIMPSAIRDGIARAAVSRNTQRRPNEAAIAPPISGPNELPMNIADEVMP